MTSIYTSVLVGVLTLGGGVGGLLLQRFLPEQHTSERSRDMLGAIVGLISLLLALVLGTLIGSAYSFYSNQKSEMETLAARSLQLDLALAQYGPEAEPLRTALRSTMTGLYDLFWRDGGADPRELTAAAILPSLRGMVGRFAALKPASDEQKQLISAIGSNEGLIQQTRLLMSLQLASPVSWPLLIVVASWSVLLFCGFGVAFPFEFYDIGGAGIGSFRGGERSVSHSGNERPLPGSPSHSARRARADDRSLEELVGDAPDHVACRRQIRTYRPLKLRQAPPEPAR
jgi:hypothetical protein